MTRLWHIDAVQVEKEESIPSSTDYYKITIGTGGATVLRPAQWSDRPYRSLYGRPLISCEYCQTAGTEGDIVLPDLSQYLLADSPPRSNLSTHVRFLYDESAFRFVFELDGFPGWGETITPANGGDSQSSVVTLQTRS